MAEHTAHETHVAHPSDDGAEQSLHRGMSESPICRIAGSGQERPPAVVRGHNARDHSASPIPSAVIMAAALERRPKRLPAPGSVWRAR